MKLVRRKSFTIDWYRWSGDTHELITVPGEPPLTSRKMAIEYARQNVPPSATHYDIRQRVDHHDVEKGWETEWVSVEEGVVSDLLPRPEDPILSIFRALHPNAVLLGDGPTIVQGHGPSHSAGTNGPIRQRERGPRKANSR